MGETVGGSGSGGLADGADSISLATGVNSAATIYGAGGSDTIAIGATAAQRTQLFGGNDGDSITLADTATGASIYGGAGGDTLVMTTGTTNQLLDGGAGADSIHAQATSALTIAGGDGADTIRFNNAGGQTADISGGALADSITVGVTAAAAVFGAATIDGGDGGDTIVAGLGFLSAGSIGGGAGNDSIRIGTATGLTYAANGTINGGAGTDTVSLAASAGAGSMVSAITTGLGHASIAYGAGDVIFLTTTAAAGIALTNGNVYVQTAASSITAGGVTAVGSLGVYSDGTDTYFAFGTAAQSAVGFKVTGKDLVTTTSTGSIAVTTSNFGFTLGGSNSTGLTITLI